MKITCEKCNALYEVADSRVPPQGLTMKCPRCQTSLSVRPPGAPAPSAVPSGAATRYYLRRRTGKVFGPFLERAIASMLEQHKLEGDEEISLDGSSWAPLASVPSLAVRGSAGRPTPAPTPAFGGPDLVDLPAPKGSLADLADLPAPKGALADLADLPAPKGGLADLADLPAPKRGVPSGRPSFDPSTNDPGEFDLGGPDEPPAAGRHGELVDLPAPRRPAAPPPRAQRATGLDYGNIELGGDAGEEISDLPAPIDLPAPKRESADLLAPKAPRPTPAPADLLQPKGPSAAQRAADTLEYGQLELGGEEEIPALDELPVSAGQSAGLALDGSFDLQAQAPGTAAPDLDASRASADVASFTPGEPEDPADVVTFAPPPREALQAAGTPVVAAPPIEPEEVLPERRPGPRRRIGRLGIAAGAGVLVVIAGILLGLLTDLGFFGLSLLTGDYGKVQRAKDRLATASAALRADTFQALSQASDDLELAAKVLGDDPRPFALQAQAAAACLHRFGPSPSRRNQADGALAKLLRLEDKSAEAAKARALVMLAGGQTAEALTSLKKVVAEDAGDSLAATYLGWAHLAARDGKAAVAAFAQALGRDPQLPAALFGTAEAHCLLKDLKACGLWAEKTLAASPGHAGALLRRAGLLTAAGKRTEAGALLRQVLGQPASPPELSMARTLLAEHAVSSGQVNEARKLLVEASRIDPRNAMAHLVMGRLYYNARQYSEAQRLFRSARIIDPTDLEIASMLAHTEIAMSRPLEARKVVDEILSAAPGAPEVVYLQGLVEETMGNLEAGSRFYKALLAREPRHFNAYYHLAKIRLREKLPDEALAILEQAESKIPVSPLVRTAQGEVLYLSGKLDPARQRLEEALRLDPNNNEAAFLLASVLADQGKLEQARDQLLSLKKRDQSYPGSAAKLGEIYLLLKQPMSAAGEYDLAVAVENPPGSVRLGAARAYLEAGKLEQALEQSGKILEADVSLSGAARAVMAEARMKQGQLDNALVEVQQALEREKKAPYFILLARIQQARNKTADALDAYTEAVRLDPANLELRLRRAVLLVKGGTVKDGLKELKQVVAKNPGSAEAHFYMGEAQADLGQEAQALQSYLTAVGKDPRHGQAHLKIAQVYLDTQKLPQAQTHLEAAVKAGQPGDPWLPDAYYYLGNVARARAQRKAAIEAYQQYLKLAPPRAPYRDDAVKKLGELGAAAGGVRE